MTYKTLKTEEDFLKLKEFCKQNDWPVPVNIDLVFGAFDEDKLVACCALKKEIVMTDLLNTTSHGHVASVLSEKAFACASLSFDSVMGFTDNPDVIELYKKAGAKIIKEGNTCFRKYV